MELALAVVEPEVLIEASQHHRQVALLVAALPVHMPFHPLAGASQELTAALHAWDSDQRELTAPVLTTDVLKA